MAENPSQATTKIHTMIGRIAEILHDQEMDDIQLMYPNLFLQALHDPVFSHISIDLQHCGTHSDEDNPAASTRLLILKAVQLINIKLKPGAAPPGYLEDRLGQMLEAITK